MRFMQIDFGWMSMKNPSIHPAYLIHHEPYKSFMRNVKIQKEDYTNSQIFYI